MKTLCSILCGLMFLFASAVRAADLQKGLQAVQRGDYVSALVEFRPLAERGDADAQFNLGAMYASGDGVRQDYAQALAWYSKAAAQGHSYAQNNLGGMYANGKGVRQDYGQALAWYRKAAAQGLVEAQYNLALKYYKGEGIPQNYAQSLAWYRKAAAQNDAPAQYFMALMYRKGQGVRQDFVSAYALLNVSAPRLSYDPNNLAKYRSKLMSSMTPAQIEAGETLTREMQKVGVLNALDAHVNK